MRNIAIKVQNLTKEYTIDYSYTESFKEHTLRKFLNRKDHHGLKSSKLLALDNISFEVNKGEAVGIIGKNGAGKSTLLKVLSGITKPTSGKIEIFGRISSILDIGVGFHPELTGRENIFMSGELNGMTRKEIRKRMKEIIDFSGVEKFIDTPVKYYSSGMFLRLAFSVFTGIDSDILLLDEVMSVGDAEFQIKSAKKLQSMFSQGKTIILVSHNPADIVKLCSRVIVLEDGKIREEGAPGKVMMEYMEESIIAAMEAPEKEVKTEDSTSEEIPEPKLQEQPKLRNVVQWDDMNTAPGNEFFRLHKILVRNENRKIEEEICSDEKIIIEIEYDKLIDFETVNIALLINDLKGIALFATSPLLSDIFETNKEYFNLKGIKHLQCQIQENLFGNALFSIDIYAWIDSERKYVNSNIITFKTRIKKSNSITEWYLQGNFSLFPYSKWQVQE